MEAFADEGTAPNTHRLLLTTFLTPLCRLQTDPPQCNWFAVIDLEDIVNCIPNDLEEIQAVKVTPVEDPPGCRYYKQKIKP